MNKDTGAGFLAPASEQSVGGLLGAVSAVQEPIVKAHAVRRKHDIEHTAFHSARDASDHRAFFVNRQRSIIRSALL